MTDTTDDDRAGMALAALIRDDYAEMYKMLESLDDGAVERMQKAVRLLPDILVVTRANRALAIELAEWERKQK